ncbi:hypothetical protein Taro_006379, partial [Colocasia esculenta]|nr:hypothetical protein [Colocasia esculenta]
LERASRRSLLREQKLHNGSFVVPLRTAEKGRPARSREKEDRDFAELELEKELRLRAVRPEEEQKGGEGSSWLGGKGRNEGQQSLSPRDCIAFTYLFPDAKVIVFVTEVLVVGVLGLSFYVQKCSSSVEKRRPIEVLGVCRL